MVILNGTNIGSTIQSHSSLASPPDSLPSPARGSPAGISPNKAGNGILPELTGLERMFNGWRRHAEKKAQQFRQREIDSETKRQQEQHEVNKIRQRLIESRMKKLEQQQQATGRTSKTGGPLIASDMPLEAIRKRKSDEDVCLGTPSDAGFSCGSPDSFTVDLGPPSAKNSKCNVNRPTPLSTEKNASVMIETYQLPPPPYYPTHQPIRQFNEPIMHNPGFMVGNYHPSTTPYYPSGPGIHFSPASTSVMPSCSQNRGMTNEKCPQITGTFRNQVNDVALPRYLEEEIIMSHDLNAALGADFLSALDALDNNCF